MLYEVEEEMDCGNILSSWYYNLITYEKDD